MTKKLSWVFRMFDWKNGIMVFRKTLYFDIDLFGVVFALFLQTLGLCFEIANFLIPQYISRKDVEV